LIEDEVVGGEFGRRGRIAQTTLEETHRYAPGRIEFLEIERLQPFESATRAGAARTNGHGTDGLAAGAGKHELRIQVVLVRAFEILREGRELRILANPICRERICPPIESRAGFGRVHGALPAPGTEPNSAAARRSAARE